MRTEGEFQQMKQERDWLLSQFMYMSGDPHNIRAEDKRRINQVMKAFPELPDNREVAQAWSFMKNSLRL